MLLKKEILKKNYFWCFQDEDTIKTFQSIKVLVNFFVKISTFYELFNYNKALLNTFKTIMTNFK